MNNNSYVLITDSNCDITEELEKELELFVMPMTFVMNDKEYKDYPDHRDMDIKEFYAQQRKGVASTTAALSPADFCDYFEPFLKNGQDIFYLAFSSGLSSTYRNGVLAAEEMMEKYTDRKIVVVDSLAASMGEGLLAYYCVQKKREGMTIDELEKWVLDNRNHLCHFFTVDDLFHLKRGGRVSAAAAVLGSALNIKPVLHVDNEGHLIPLSKVRGRRQSLDALVKKMQETAINPAEQMIFISHGDAESDAQYVANQVKEKLGVKNVVINFIGPTIGTHSGPGTVALFFMGTEK